jgi:microsomal dipeptidase-like Zn-dependent dipeptidase
LLDIDRFKQRASDLIAHHQKNVRSLEQIDADQHEAAALELKNVILVEVIQPLEEMVLMLELFEKMGLLNVPRTMVAKWELNFNCLLTRLEVLE